MRLKQILAELEAEEAAREQHILVSLAFTGLWIDAHVTDPIENAYLKQKAVEEARFQLDFGDCY